MSKKRADRPDAGSHDDDGDDEKQHASNKSARLGIGHQAASSVAAPPTMLPFRCPAQRLYSDALISVFRFFDLADVISAHASCRAWRDAARKEPSRELSLCRLPTRLEWMSLSPLKHHLAHYSSRSGYNGVVRDPAHLALLRQFPNLTDVGITFDIAAIRRLKPTHVDAPPEASPDAVLDAVWPIKLARMDLYIPAGDDPVAVASTLQQMIESLARRPTMRELRMALTYTRRWRYSLQPLLSVPMRALTLEGVDAAGFTVIKAMTALERLTLFNTTVKSEMLQLLCAEPHQLVRLSSLTLQSTKVTEAHLAPLLSLPALTALDMHSLTDDALPLLSRSRQLRDLRIQYLTHSLAAKHVITHLTECSNLTAIAMSIGRVSPDDLTTLANALTGLQSLQLAHASFDNQPRLGCLRTMTQLRVLLLPQCVGLSLACLDADFTAMRSLRELTIAVPEAEVSAAHALLSQSMPLLSNLNVQSEY